MEHDKMLARLKDLPEGEAKHRRAAHEIRRLAHDFTQLTDAKPHNIDELEQEAQALIEANVKTHGAFLLGTTWQIRTYAAKGQRNFANIHRDQFALALLLADLVTYAMWPFRRDYNPKFQWPMNETFNYSIGLLQQALDPQWMGMEHKFGEAASHWVETIRAFGQTLNWDVKAFDDKGNYKPRIRNTVCESVNNLRLQLEELFAVQGEDLVNIKREVAGIKAHNEAAGKDTANLFSQQHALHEKMESLFSAMEGMNAKIDILAAAMEALLRRTVEPAQRIGVDADHAELAMHKQELKAEEQRAEFEANAHAIAEIKADIAFKQSEHMSECEAQAKWGGRDVTCYALPCGCTNRKTCKQHTPPVCPGCKNEIDPDTCHCGDAIIEGRAHDNHHPVPMGCTCGYATQPGQPAPFVQPPKPLVATLVEPPAEIE